MYSLDLHVWAYGVVNLDSIRVAENIKKVED